MKRLVFCTLMATLLLCTAGCSAVHEANVEIDTEEFTHTPETTLTPVPLSEVLNTHLPSGTVADIIKSGDTETLLPAATTLQPTPAITQQSAAADVHANTKPFAADRPSPSPRAITTQVGVIPLTSPAPASTLGAPVEPIASDEIIAITGAYIDEALRGVNESRARVGNGTVMENAELTQKAQAHAYRMAEEQRMFHSNYGLFESVATGTEGALTGLSLGAQSAVHAHDIMDDPNITQIGIGVYQRGDTIYACIVADW